MLLLALACVLLAYAATAEQCSSWCNPYTTAMSSCAGCSVTAEVDGGKYCAGWCNAYTCGNGYCAGCAFWPCDPCAIETSFAFDPQSIPNDEYNLLAHNAYYQTTLRPNACNVCPTAGHEPIWAAPGDLCIILKEAGHPAPDLCGPAGLDWATDFKPEHHVKACVTPAQLKTLWDNGACHNVNTTLPYVAKQGLLFCAKTGHVRSQCLAPNTFYGNDLYRCGNDIGSFMQGPFAGSFCRFCCMTFESNPRMCSNQLNTYNTEYGADNFVSCINQVRDGGLWFSPDSPALFCAIDGLCCAAMADSDST